MAAARPCPSCTCFKYPDHLGFLMDPSLLGFNGRRHGLHGRSLGDGLAGIGLWLGLSFGLHFGHGPDHLGCNLLLLLWDILQDAPWARPGGTGLLHGNLHGWHDCTQKAWICNWAAWMLGAVPCKHLKWPRSLAKHWNAIYGYTLEMPCVAVT